MPSPMLLYKLPAAAASVPHSRIDLGRGELKIWSGGDPAAGNEMGEVVPAGKAWQILSVDVTLSQGITQTPLPVLIIDDGTNNLLRCPGSSVAQTASTNAEYTWAPGLALTGQIAGTVVVSTGPIPQGLIIPAAYRIRTVTQGIGANSNYGVPRIYVVEYDLL